MKPSPCFTKFLLAALCATWVATTPAAEPAKKPAAKTKIPAPKKAPAPVPPPPTLANVRYGTHERNVLDFWRAESAHPTPLLFFIHGGGWMAGDKSRIQSLVKVEALLAAGISVVSINYRYVSPAHAAGIPCELVYPGAPQVRHATVSEYLIAPLKPARP